ncbi:MAG: ATP-binding protein [Acidimicrobiales bacterium]|jgi:type IV secretory pathway VirB4 component
MKLPAHESTTAQLGVAYPFVASVPCQASRVFIGQDLAGGPFFHDPFELYQAGILTNPNITVFGQIGRGKSALVKTYLLREAAFGRQVAVLDPKGEYGELARALGSQSLALSPGGSIRVNPLDGPASPPGMTVARHRLVLLGTLASACLRRSLTPREHAALELALGAATRANLERASGPPTLPDVVRSLLRPLAESAQIVGTTKSGLENDGRDVGLELRRLVEGDLAGMFDGPTTPGIDPGSGVLIVDLSAVYHSEALGALMVCASAWLQAMTALREAQTILVVDEAWAILTELAVARYLRSSWKLARSYGLANVAVCHRATDLGASGPAGSEQSRLAEGLLADSETVVCYAQPTSELATLAGLLGCSREELEFLPRLRRGVALWLVGRRRFLVEHLLGSQERALVDTDARLVTRTEP